MRNLAAGRALALAGQVAFASIAVRRPALARARTQPAIYVGRKLASEQAAPARWRLWLLILLSVSVVMLVVLLANDMKHLRQFSRYLETTGPAVPPATVLHPLTVKPNRDFDLPLAVLREPTVPLAARFVRRWLPSGPQLCEALRGAGANVGDWRQSAFDDRTFECVAEISIEPADRAKSVFVQVRGQGAGEVGSVRVKLVAPELTPDGRLAGNVAQLFETTLREAAWTDLASLLSRIERLQDVTEARFGSLLIFKKEPSSESSYNFILGLQSDDDAQRAVASFFSAANWLPYAPPTGEVTAPTHLN